MGKLQYDGESFEMDDRVLAHVKLAVVRKLRKQESFLLNWVKPAEEGGGRVSIWLSPASIILFKFSGGRPPAVNQTWLRVLEMTSHTPRGLTVMPESDAEEYARKHAERLTGEAAPEAALQL